MLVKTRGVNIPEIRAVPACPLFLCFTIFPDVRWVSTKMKARESQKNVLRIQPYYFIVKRKKKMRGRKNRGLLLLVITNHYGKAPPSPKGAAQQY